MVSHKSHNFIGNEGFEIFLASKLIICFIDNFTSKMKIQTIAYLLNESEHMYWILDLEGEVHSIWDWRISGLQKCNNNGFFKVGRGGLKFLGGSKKSRVRYGGCPCPYLPPPKARKGRFTVPLARQGNHGTVVG